MDALAVRDAVRLLDEVLLGVEDDLVGARFPGELRLLLGSRGPDHGRPPQLGELDEQEPDPAGRGVHERRLSFLKGEGAVRQVVGGHALEHHRGGDPRLDERDVEGHQVLGGGDHVLGVGPGRARERHVVSGRHVLDALAHGVHLARAFEPERAGHVAGVEARALVDVDKVHARGGELYARLDRGPVRGSPRPRNRGPPARQTRVIRTAFMVLSSPR